MKDYTIEAFDYNESTDSNIEWMIPIKEGVDFDPIKTIIVKNAPLIEVQETERVLEAVYPNKKGTMMDIGANIGIYSVYYATKGWNVVAIEAADENAEALRMTARNNNLKINVVEKILHEKEGKLFFYVSGPFGRCIPQYDVDDYVKRGLKVISVDSISLDEMLKMGGRF